MEIVVAWTIPLNEQTERGHFDNERMKHGWYIFVLNNVMIKLNIKKVLWGLY